MHVLQVQPPPPEFFCPITQERMLDPVVASDGHSYERDAIVHVIFRSNGISPLTRETLRHAYLGSEIVRVADDQPDEVLLRRSMTPVDTLDLHVFGAKDGRQARLVAVLDNLGKGASGAAVQNLNLMAGLPETAGLRL